MQVEGTPATAELDVLLVVEIVLVTEKDNATLGDQGCKLFGLLLGQLRETNAVQLCAELGRVIDALSDASKEGLLLGVSAPASDAGGDCVAIDEGAVLVDGEYNVGGDCWSWSGGHVLALLVDLVVVWFR